MKKSALRSRAGGPEPRGGVAVRQPPQQPSQEDGGIGGSGKQPPHRPRPGTGGSENDAPLTNGPGNGGAGGYRRGGAYKPMQGGNAGNVTMNRQHQQQQQAQQQQQQYRQPMPNGHANGGMHHNPNMRRPMGGGPGSDEANAALGQKNHRLAKELSDLRVRHREETKVVSRLTMENMNLASRCREAIAQVAALKKEVLVYQKRQSEWGTLQREVMQLRKQIDKNAASGKEGGGGNSGQKRSSMGSPDVGAGGAEGRRSISPATDLDRIMSQQFRKQENAAVEGAAAGDEEKKDGSGGGLAKKFQNLRVSTSQQSTSDSAKVASATTSNNKQQQAGRPTAATNLASSNTKIPISVAPSSTKSSAADQKDDEFDADIDMVDFFSKSQSALSSSGSSSPLGESPTGKGTSAHLGSRAHHARKPKSTDDHMPGDVVPISPGSDKKNAKKASSTSPGDNLLSSLDAFEASFASAFPETSFSITSEAPMSSAKLDMSFDTPDFDPFFKSPTNSSKKGPGGSQAGKGSSGSKSQMIEDLFPEAMNFKASPKMELAFDPSPVSFAPMDESRAHQTKGRSGSGADPTSKEERASQKRGAGGHRQQLSPQSMSAEIEQLDAIADLASSGDRPESKSGGGASSSAGGNAVPSRPTRSIRKVKQPVSYAEPSTKSKLRRGDVLFPKVDAADKNKKMELDSSSSKVGERATSPATDLDRIMGQMSSDVK